MLAIRDDLGTSTLQEELIMSAAKLGAIVGTFFGGATMLHFGRRRALFLDSSLFALGPLVMALSPGVAGLVVGRLIVGGGIGVSAAVVPAYLAELAPARYRGATVEMYELMLTLGALIAVLVDAALSGVAHDWRWMVGAPLPFAVLLALCAIFLPESPRWLVIQDRLDDALAVIHRIFTNTVLLPGDGGKRGRAQEP